VYSTGSGEHISSICPDAYNCAWNHS